MNNEQWQKDVRKRRLDYGVTQQKLATASGISRDYYNKIENGNIVPSDK